MRSGQYGAPRNGMSRCEQGSGSVLALALCAMMILLAAGTYVVLSTALASAAAARAADLTALAATDAARGLSTGYPCDAARETAAQNGVELRRCDIGGKHRTEVTVEVVSPVLALPRNAVTWLEIPGVETRASSRAGPPPDGS